MFGRKIKNIKIYDDYIAEVTFDTDETRKIDFKKVIQNFKGIASPLRDKEYFKTATVKNGVLTWESGYDICPDYLYMFDEHGFKQEFLEYAPQKILDTLSLEKR